MIHTTTILVGLCVMAVCAAVVIWRGGPLERLVMAAAAICWVGSSVGQFVADDPVTPIVIADVAFSGFLLVLIFRRHRGWLYGVFALEAARLVLHAMAYEHQVDPSAVYRLANNVLSSLALLVIVVASLGRRRGLVGEPARPV